MISASGKLHGSVEVHAPEQSRWDVQCADIGRDARRGVREDAASKTNAASRTRPLEGWRRVHPEHASRLRAGVAISMRHRRGKEKRIAGLESESFAAHGYLEFSFEYVSHLFALVFD